MKSFSISPGAVLLLSVIFFFAGLSDLAALLSGALVHELGHIAAICAFGGKITGFSFNLTGMRIDHSGIISETGEIVCLLAGPLSGVALAYSASYFGNITHNAFLLKTAGFSIALSAFNLLPAPILDGGRALILILNHFFAISTSERAVEVLGFLCALAMLTAALYYHSYEFSPVIFGGGLALMLSQSGIVKS